MNPSTVIKLLLLLAIFGLVLGVTYPIQRQAIEEEKLHNYPRMVATEEAYALRDYQEALKHPEKLDALLAARDRFAASEWRQFRYPSAIKVYQDQMASTWGLINNAYNEKWANACLNLAGVHRDAENQAAALICYDSVLQHDQKFLPPNDLRIARDLNNMGLMHYLIGSGKPDKKDRVAEFKISADFYRKSLDMLKAQGQDKSTRAEATFWNLYLAERDQDNLTAAQAYKEQAQALDKTLNRICREP